MNAVSIASRLELVAEDASIVGISRRHDGNSLVLGIARSSQRAIDDLLAQAALLDDHRPAIGDGRAVQMTRAAAIRG